MNKCLKGLKLKVIRNTTNTFLIMLNLYSFKRKHFARFKTKQQQKNTTTTTTNKQITNNCIIRMDATSTCKTDS